MLLAPFTGEVPEYKTVETGMSGDGHTRYVVLRRPDGGMDCVAWTKRMEVPLEHGPVDSDGGFVWVREDASGKSVRMFVAGATHVEYRGVALLDAPEKQTGSVEL